MLTHYAYKEQVRVWGETDGKEAVFRDIENQKRKRDRRSTRSAERWSAQKDGTE